MSNETEPSLPGEDPLDQILAEYLQAADTSSRPDQQAFLDRYPEHAADLREFFASQERFEHAAQPFRFDAAVNQGPWTPAASASSGKMEEVAGQSPLGSAASPGQRVRYFGEYELLQEIARGGMGVVFKAKQVRLNRVVALKMILAGQFASAEDVKRFQVEAQNAAWLDHPNIVPVYEVGRHKGQYYFTMKLVEGSSLSGRAGQFANDPKAAVTLLATVARAVDYAHQRGILHRDVKPGNILIDGAGQPQVTDFGLARRLDDNTQAAKITLTGAIVGSPSYMAPEQARGERGLTVAADVYALGAVLYELLTGRPPFNGANTLEVLEQVRHSAPARPLSINAAVGRDLEVVCLKCLDKQPQRRYASARALAEDLERWSRGEPITARPVGAAERLWRWCRRKPALASAAGLAIAATLAALAILTIAVVLISRSRDRQEALAKNEGIARLEQEAQRQRADRNARAAALSEKKAEERLATGLVGAGDSLLSSGRAVDARGSYWQAWSIDRRQGLLEFPVIAGLVQSYASSPPPLLSPLTRDGKVAVPFQHEQRVDGAAISPDGRMVLSASGKMVRLWKAATGQLIRSYRGHTALVVAVAFSDDGLHALSGGDDRSVRYWDLKDGSFRVLGVHGARVTGVAFSPDGRSGASSSWDATCRVWDLAGGGQRAQFAPRGGSAFNVVFSPDGRTALTATGQGSLWHWNVATGKPIRRIQASTANEPWIFAVAFGRDGRTALSGGADNIVRLWDLSDGALLRTFRGHTGSVWGLAVLPDGNSALSASDDWTLKLWDLSTGEMRRVLTGHTDVIRSLTVSQDGRIALTASADKTVKLWDLSGGNDSAVFSGQADAVRSVDVSRDGRLALLVSAGKNPSLRVWDVATRRQLRACTLSSLSGMGVPLPYSTSCAATLSRDGRSVLVGCGDGSVRLWDSITGKARFAISGHSGAVNAVAFSADGTLAASGAADGTLRVWDLPAGKARPTIKGHRRGIESIAFSPDGSLLVSASDDYTLALWDVAKGGSKGVMKGHTDRVVGVTFSPDGRTAISASVDQTLRLWDVSTCQTLRIFKGHWHYATGVALAPDGRTAASSSLDGTVRLWDVATARQLAILTGHFGGVNCVAFSGDGRSLLSGGADQTVRQWDFDRPRSYEKWEAILAQAHETLGRRPDDPTSLAVFGEWYAFRGIDAWAVELLEKARTGHATVSHLTLARCYWRLGLTLEAEREFRAAADGPVTSDTYFGRCINGLVPSSGPSIAGPAPSLDALAMLQVRRGDFKEAAAAYAKSIESDPTNHMTWILRAGLLASVGYRDAYAAHCHAMLERFGNTDDPLIAERVAKACLLLPEAGVDPRRPLALVERSVSQDNDHYRAWAQFAKGLALYRCGEPTARAWLLRSKSPFDFHRSQVADLLLAEIDVRHAPTPEADGALRRALGTIDFNASEIMDNATGPGFVNLMNCQTLGREAQELLKTHAHPAESPGPPNRAAATAPVTKAGHD